MAKDNIVSMQSDEADIAGATDDLVDEMGNIVTLKGKDEGSEGDLEPDPDPDDKDKDKDDEWKGIPDKAYQRFKSVNDKVKDLEKQLSGKDTDLVAFERDANAFRELMRDEKFQKLLGKHLSGEEIPP